MFIDCHSHIHQNNFDADRDEVVERALKAGVSKIIEVGFDPEGIYKALALAKKHDFVFSTAGIHPHLASDWNDDLGAKILKLAKNEEKIVALGEMGLDYYKNFQPKDVQRHAFIAQLALAQKLELPVVIHCRDAFEDFFAIMDEMKFAGKVLMHCFTGTEAEAREGLERGYFIAFTGIITYPSAGNLRKVAMNAPLDRILLETDCPFLPPQRYRGKRNEPSFVVDAYEEVAKIKGLGTRELAKQVMANAGRFFGV